MHQHFRFSQGPFQTIGFKGEPFDFLGFSGFFRRRISSARIIISLPAPNVNSFFHIFHIFYIFCNSSLLRWIRQVFILVCREHPDSKVSFKLSVHGITHLLRLLQRKLQINPFFLMVNYGSAVKHSIYDRKISAKLRFCGKKWRWDPWSPWENYGSCMENWFCNRIRQKNCTDLTEKIPFASV